MAFVIGIYGSPLEECPRPGCRNNKFVVLGSGGRRCSVCNIWFDTRTKPPPRPFRIPSVATGFKQIRAERQWFRNVMIFPSDLHILSSSHHRPNHLVFTKIVQSPSEILSKYSTSNLGIDTSNPTADEIIRMVAEYSCISVEELQKMSASEAEVLSHALDSLICIQILYKLGTIGFHVPMADLKRFLACFITSQSNL